MGKSSPAPGDYKGAAMGDAAYSQAQADRQTQANRPNVTTPFGGVSWTKGPNGEWQMSSSLSPEVQSAFQGMQPFDLASFGKLDNGTAARDQTIESAYNAATRRLNPQFAQRGEALNSQLANQGLDPNSAAARNAQRDFAAQRNDAYAGAMSNAIAQGNAAQDSVFRNNMAARQQAIAEALRARGMPLEDLRGLMGFLPSAQGFNTAGRGSDLQGLQATGMQDDAAFRKWQADMQANADLAGGIFKGLTGLAGFFL